jgi:hypothetical protein
VTITFVWRERRAGEKAMIEFRLMIRKCLDLVGMAVWCTLLV